MCVYGGGGQVRKGWVRRGTRYRDDITFVVLLLDRDSDGPDPSHGARISESSESVIRDLGGPRLGRSPAAAAVALVSQDD